MLDMQGAKNIAFVVIEEASEIYSFHCKVLVYLGKCHQFIAQYDFKLYNEAA